MATQNNSENESGSKFPPWIKAELFEETLKNVFPNFKSVRNFKVGAGTTPGENYATIMLRVKIEVELSDGQTKDTSFMLKVGHDTDLLKEVKLFESEQTMYKTIVPELERMYADVGLNVKFGAQHYTIKAPSEYILLEDLSLKGFKNANRFEGLDVAHTHSVLKKLAQWHAASAVRVVNNGPYPTKIVQGLYKEENLQFMDKVSNDLGKSLLNCMETYNGHEEYIDKVKDLQPKTTQVIMSLGLVDTNGFNVLNHGDCWSNNIMFQYDAFGKIKETYLIDYQLPTYGTVAQDLYYFLLSSVRFEDKLSQFDANIKYYHDQLVEHLKLLKYSKPLPALKDIHTALFKYGVWGYLTATGVMAGILLDPTDNASIENFLSDSTEGANLKMTFFSNARYRKHIEVVLPWLLNRGALEV